MLVRPCQGSIPLQPEGGPVLFINKHKRHFLPVFKDIWKMSRIELENKLYQALLIL